jgi:phage tail P2-like protein
MSILASSIQNVDHFVAFDIIAKKRFSQLQLDAILVYIIDTVDVSAIPALAEQFDVLGYKGMKLATTEEQQRELIKRAIELHRYKGTLWAVKEALKSIGYPDAVITEGVGVGPTGWAEFRIDLDGGANQVSASSIDELVKMVNEYKNTRSHLADISYTIDLGNDDINVLDEVEANPSQDVEDVVFAGGDFRYNGEEIFNGANNYSQDSDVLEIEIINI